MITNTEKPSYRFIDLHYSYRLIETLSLTALAAAKVETKGLWVQASKASKVEFFRIWSQMINKMISFPQSEWTRICSKMISLSQSERTIWKFSFMIVSLGIFMESDIFKWALLCGHPFVNFLPCETKHLNNRKSIVILLREMTSSFWIFYQSFK